MKIKEDVMLASYTTLGVGGPARYFVVVRSVEELKEVIGFSKEKGKPVFVLGEGANVLISDKGLDGLVAKLEMKDISFKDEDKNTVKVFAGAGALWDDVVSSCVERGLRGLENTSGIPGSVGAAIVGNIAAYGHAVSDTLMSVDVVDAEKAEDGVKTIPASDLGLRYRYSDFQNEKLGSYIIVRATFALNRNTAPKLEYESALKVMRELEIDYADIKEHRAVIMEARNRAGSLLLDEHNVGAKTAGSFFRNPEVPVELAGRILEYEEFGVSKEGILRQNLVHGGTAARISAAHVLLAAGFKRGQQWGQVRLHPKHILKIENLGGAKAQDIYNVSEEIISTVKNKFGIDLEPEVRFIGEFEKNS